MGAVQGTEGTVWCRGAGQRVQYLLMWKPRLGPKQLKGVLGSKQAGHMDLVTQMVQRSQMLGPPPIQKVAT
ncbi:unnamed protein product [Staurois parvus]|uniref:Uncharacterized protein n=1 Tax=Staurois parvus TaxID=386267 RepID=A0ABN9F7I6_9NEOB|nr:unnamed protein product [Staurois parvus]